MSWQKQEQCWTNDVWQKREQKLCSRKERRCLHRTQWSADSERGEKRRRNGEKENETEIVKRRCEGFVSVEAFEIFIQVGDLESCGDLSCEDLLDKPEELSDCESEAWVVVHEVPDVTNVLVSPSSVVTELCYRFSCGSDLDFVEPQSFSFSKKRSFLHSRRKRCGLKNHK